MIWSAINCTRKVSNFTRLRLGKLQTLLVKLICTPQIMLLHIQKLSIIGHHPYSDALARNMDNIVREVDGNTRDVRTFLLAIRVAV